MGLEFCWCNSTHYVSSTDWIPLVRVDDTDSLVVGLLAVYFLDTYFCRRRHPQEPPYLRPKIPLVGHLVGLVLHGSDYYQKISPGQPELFTVPIFAFRIYVLNSRHLFPVIVRNAKTLSFRPFSKLASKVWCGASEPFMEMHEEGHRFIEDLFRDTRVALAPGPAIDYQNLRTGDSLQRSIDQLERDVGQGGKKSFAMYQWIHHIMSIAATDGVYGDNNPFRDPQVERDYWIWNEGIKKQTAKFPQMFISRELAARDRVFKAFEKYLQSDWSDASEVIKIRINLYARDGVMLADQALHITSFNLALLGNTVPTSFWALYDIISRPQLLADIRAEIETHAVLRANGEGEPSFELDVAALRVKCPLLLSSYQETQRVRSIHAMVREVVADTLIESPTTETTYFLSKGQYVQMPSGPIHKDQNIWGSNAAAFDPYRFVKDSATVPRSEMPTSYAFLPWGSPPHLCPARQFASTEVMLFVALMVLRFDFTRSGEGGWQSPELKVGELTTTMAPKNEVFADVRQRNGWMGKWVLMMGESSKKIPLASG